MDPFLDPNRPHMARGTHSIGGMPVVVTPHMPREHAGHEIVPRPRVVRCLRIVQYVPFVRRMPKRWWPRWYRVGKRIEREQFFIAAGKLFCSPAGFQELKAGIRG